jgi:prepilin-type N-terminal cleavage/methylation domain-containing protein
MRPQKNDHINIVHNQTGFTLIEALISIVVLSVGMLGLIKTVDSVMYFQNRSSETTRATLLVTNQIEEIKRLSTNEPSSRFGFDYLVREYAAETGMTVIDDTTFSINKSFDGENGEPTIQTILTFRTFPPEANISFNTPELINLLEVIVKAEWNDSKGRPKFVELGSLIHRRQFIE